MEIDLKNKTPDIRYLNDMQEVIYDKKWLKRAPNFGVYYMYRNIKKRNGLQYDITIIKSRMLGKEFAKTKGHKHVGKYQEVFIILKGEAVFLMQKMKKDNIEDVYAVKAKKGDAVIVAPYYSHIAINASEKDVTMGNWIPLNCKRNYKQVGEKQGLSYYYTKNGWINNKNYKKIPKLRFEKPLKGLPKDLSFLKE